ncbi:MAG: CHAT domain-containing protein [Thermoanaerobaculia bacterium]
MELGRVFISSAFSRLLGLREMVADAARLVGLEPVLTDDHVAHAGTVQERLAREIELCDTYVGLFDLRRGTVPTGTSSRAIMEEEFRIARENGLRRLVFLPELAAVEHDPELKAFLDREVSEYRGGVWTHVYKDEGDLALEVPAALSALRPRVVLALSPHPGEERRAWEKRDGAAMSAQLHLEGVKPAWSGAAVLGPVEVDLALGRIAKKVFRQFQEDASYRNQLREESLHTAGAELAAQIFPGALGEALEAVLDRASHASRLVALEIRTGDSDALGLPWELLSFPRHPLPIRQGLIELIRHVPPPGEASDPTHDPAPKIPANHIAILGFTASPLEDQSVRALAGTGPGGLRDSDLFWESEQERLLVALDDLVRTGRGRLILPDTGDKEELRKQLAREDRPQIVHLSCHGGLAEGQPTLFLEDSEGHRAPVRADEILAWMRATPGALPLDLLVLSACDTSKAAGLVDQLVRGGVPRVLGMQSTVSDAGATAFAGAFYAALARGTDLPAALRSGRAELLAKGGPHEWAIPTLTLSRDAGPLVAPRSSEPLKAPFELVRDEFEIEGVTYLERGYVGRREVERRLRKALDTQRVIVVHGLGGIGKSTLIARFLERRRQEGARLLVLYAGQELTPAPFLEEIASRLGVSRASDVSPAEAERQFQTNLQTALRSVTPTILLLDNFEDNQNGDGQLKNPALGEALADLVHLGGTGFRLVLTSRLPVDLPDLASGVWNCDLGELSLSGCRKFRLLDPEGLGKLEDDAWRKVMFYLGGHPKALELLGGYLKERTDRARTLIESFGQVTEVVDAKLAGKRQERGRALLVDTVLAEVPEERLPSFDRLCLLEEPLPSQELIDLLAADGRSHPSSDLAWLRDHGLLARKVSPTALSGGDAVHRLLASRRENALAEREGEVTARAWHLRLAEHFVKRAGPLSDFGSAARHRGAAGDRVGALELYHRWALSLRDRHAYAASIQIAQEGLQEFSPCEVEVEKVAAASLWNTIHDGLIRLGMISEAGAALTRAFDLVEGSASPEARFERARVRILRGRALANAGQPQEARLELEAAYTDLKEGGHERERAVTLGDIARLRSQTGDVAGALKLHEERLRIFEQLGDLRSRAVTLGDIARLRSQAGDAAGSLKLLEEMIRIFEQLGDVRSRAVTLGDIARLRSQAGDLAGTLKLHEERLHFFDQLGDVRERAVTMGDIARLRSQAGDVAGALKLYEEILRILDQLGDMRSRAVTLGDIARLRSQAGDVAAALKLHEERLHIFDQIGDVRERAVTLGDIARLRAEAGDIAEARALQSERLEVNRKLGDIDGIAAALYDVARLDLVEEKIKDAVARLAESWILINRIGRADAIAFVGLLYGQLLGVVDPDQAAAVLRKSKEAFLLLGMASEADEVEEMMATLSVDESSG